MRSALAIVPIAPAASGPTPISTGIGIDIPRAALTELVGAVSSGRTALALTLLQEVTRREEFCVLVDVKDMFDPVSGAEAGIDLSRLLWVRCGGNVEHALKATDLLVRAGGFALVMLDVSGVPPATMRRIPIASWFRLRHGAEHSGAALVVTGERPEAGSCSQLQLAVRRQEALWSARLLRGIRSVAGSIKRGGQIGKPASVRFDSRAR
jgi:recA bacterial DNA recombination protein